MYDDYGQKVLTPLDFLPQAHPWEFWYTNNGRPGMSLSWMIDGRIYCSRKGTDESWSARLERNPYAVPREPEEYGPFPSFAALRSGMAIIAGTKC